jgi:heme exporter protein A
MSDGWAIESRCLGKAFGHTVALREVDLRVGWGERVVLFGPNGAGKTTLLRLLAMLLRPSTGELRLAGHDPDGAGPALRRLVGFLGHQPALYPDLTVAENLAFYARLYRLTDAPKRAGELVGRLGLSRRQGDRAGALSRGLQQRLGLARALLADPPIVLLDEPDTGLDAPGLDLLGELLAAPGRTVLLSTHDRELGRRVCGRAVVLGAGSVVSDGPLGPAADAGRAA